MAIVLCVVTGQAPTNLEGKNKIALIENAPPKKIRHKTKSSNTVPMSRTRIVFIRPMLFADTYLVLVCCRVLRQAYAHPERERVGIHPYQPETQIEVPIARE